MSINKIEPGLFLKKDGDVICDKCLDPSEIFSKDPASNKLLIHPVSIYINREFIINTGSPAKCETCGATV